MKKLLLLSVILATIAIPSRLARSKNPKQAIKQALAYMAMFNVGYLINLVFLQ